MSRRVSSDIVSEEVYSNLILLHVAVLILVDPVLCKTNTNLAQTLMEHYVDSFSDVYGSDHVVYNVHSLVQIVDDVKKHGSLDSYSAFPFESFMFQIKRMLRKNNDCIQQVCNRIEETYKIYASYTLQNTVPIEFKRKCKVNNVYKEVVFQNFTINTKPRDQWFLTDEGEVFKFDHIERKSSGDNVYAFKVTDICPFYNLPICSTKLNIYKSEEKISEIMSIDISRVANKVFAIPFQNFTIFSPLRHTK